MTPPTIWNQKQTFIRSKQTNKQRWRHTGSDTLPRQHKRWCYNKEFSFSFTMLFHLFVCFGFQVNWFLTSDKRNVTFNQDQLIMDDENGPGCFFSLFGSWIIYWCPSLNVKSNADSSYRPNAQVFCSQHSHHHWFLCTNYTFVSVFSLLCNSLSLHRTVLSFKCCITNWVTRM